MPQNSFQIGAPPARRRPSLTPMIDVVFLLLVFFMLAARFGLDTAIPLSPALQGSGEYTGPPRLVSVAPDGVHLNGRTVDPTKLVAEIGALMPDPDAIVVVRPVDGANLQRVIDVMDRLSAAGITRIVLAE